MSNSAANHNRHPYDEPVPIYLGPYETWNFGDGRPYALPALRQNVDYITALAEIAVYQAADDASAQVDGTVESETRRPAWNPTLWKPERLKFRPFVVYNSSGHIDGPTELAQILGAGLKHLTSPLIVNIKESRARVAFPIPPRAMHSDQGNDPAPSDWQPDPGLRDRIGKDKRITIFAIIDDGLPFAHRNFRDKDGTRTRVEFCWLQGATICDQQHSVLFGREYTREGIEKYIKDFGDDEDTLYREAGATTDQDELGSLINRHATHGAHVMDLGTGYAEDRGDTPAEEVRIIAVQLPNTIAWDTSGFGKDMYMLSAFHYIFDRADRIAAGYQEGSVRLVINFSYGFSGGRHDGGTELEAAINEMIQLRRKLTGPTALVVPSGNSFLEAMHARIREADFKDNRAALYWRIQPNDRTSSYLEMWFVKGIDPSAYSVELYDPLGRVRQTITVTPDPDIKDGDPRRSSGLQNQGGQTAGQLTADKHRSDLWRVLVVMAPTEPDDASLPAMEAGKWTVVMSRTDAAGPLKLPIECWIQRADDPENLRSGCRQSYFDHPDNIRYTPQGDVKETDTFESEVKRFGSLSGLATGQTSLIVGGYRLGAGVGSSLKYARPSSYSSAGTRGDTGLFAQVACSSMSDRSRVLTGTWAAGNRSGSLSLVVGTSAAAPFVARQLVTAFVTAEEDAVKKAETQNYLDLLRGWDGNADDLTKARLGTVRVPPHWQPGLDLKLLDDK